MLGLTDPLFWLLVGCVTLVVRGFSLRGVWRGAVFVAATGLLFAGAPQQLAVIFGICLYSFVALRFFRGWKGIALHTLVMSALFLLSQYPAALPDRPIAEQVLPLIGLPYLYLRSLHLMIEVANERMPAPGAVAYAAYILPFHQVIAGPIDRFGPVQDELNAPLAPLDTDTLLYAISRITNGFLKKTVLAELLFRGIGFRYEFSGLRTLAEIDLYALYIYLDFSGYMDIIIGVGMLIGYRPSENFDWPYSSRNLIEFWTRWHITLGTWLRDYIFIPLNLWLQRGPLRGRMLSAGVLTYFVVMVLCGLWHRANPQFMLWGVLHGIGIVAVKYYEWGLKRALGKKGLRTYRSSRPARWAATLLTFHFVAFSFLFAFHSPSRALEILWSLF